MDDDPRLKDYLGDGVYVRYSCGQIVLSTIEDDVIYLEPEVYRKLVAFEQRLRPSAKG